MDKPPVVHISEQKLGDLLAKILNPSAEALAVDERQLLGEIITGYAHIFERTERGDISLKVLQAMFGIPPPTKPEGGKGGGGGSGGSSGGTPRDDASKGAEGAGTPSGEANKSGSDAGSSPDSGEAKATGEGTQGQEPPPTKPEVYGPWPSNRNEHGRRGPEDFPDAPIITCAHDELKPGDPCPECLKGKLIQHSPNYFVAIDASSPFSAMRIRAERLYCPFCKKAFTAPLPAHLVEAGCDGTRLYGHAAVAQIAINKYFGGTPWYRTQSLEAMMDFHLPDSSQWDQSEHQANVLYPIVRELYRQAALVWLAYIDDTSGKILSLTSKIIEQRVTGKETERYGCHTSLFVGQMDDRKLIYLYKTGIQHSGEMMDLVFKGRPEGLPIPQVMADAGSCNTATVTKIILNLCMAHLFRKFEDAKEKFPRDATNALELLGVIFKNDARTRSIAMTREERQAYHWEHSRPVFKELAYVAFAAIKAKHYEPGEDIMKAYSYLLNNEAGLAGFYKRAGAPLTNNLAERGFQKIMPVRNNCYHFRNVVGSGVADVIWTAGVTANANGENVHHYFTSAQRFKDIVREEPHRFLPWNYRQTIDIEVTRRSSRPADHPSAHTWPPRPA